MQNVTLRLPEDMVDDLDDEADEQGVTRSEYIREVLQARNEDDVTQAEYDALQDEYERLQAEHERLREHCEERETILAKLETIENTMATEEQTRRIEQRMATADQLDTQDTSRVAWVRKLLS